MSNKNEMKDRKSSSDVDKSEITTKAFSILHERLLSSGKVTSKNLSLSGLKTNLCPKSANVNPVIAAQRSSSLYSNKDMAVDPLKKPKLETAKNLGKGWFNLEPMKMDAKLRTDIKMIQMRNYIDPKRFYKNPDKLGSVVHIGTVIQGPAEYKSARLTNKERRGTIVEEILADKDIKSYSKRKFMEIQASKAPGRKKKNGSGKANKNSGNSKKSFSLY